MEKLADDRGRFVSLYFQSSETVGAKWHLLEEMCPPQFQIDTLRTVAADTFLSIVLKKLVILALMFCVIPFSHADNAAPASGTAQGQKPADSTAPAAVQEHHGSNPQQGPPQNQATNEPKSMRIILPPKDKYDYIAFSANLLLVAVGIGGIIVAVCTLKKIERQTTATEIAASAASKSADIAANAERAWIVTAQARFVPDMPDLAEKGAPIKSKVLVELHNAGRSPAEIVRAHVVTFLFPREFQLNNVPLYGETPDEYAIRAMPGEFFPSGEKHWMNCRILEAEFLTKEDREDVNTGAKRLFCYGKIEYKDGSGETRTTQFGYYFHVRLTPTDDRPEAMYRIENPAYNFTI
jgi:hypothetical protein